MDVAQVAENKLGKPLVDMCLLPWFTYGPDVANRSGVGHLLNSLLSLHLSRFLIKQKTFFATSTFDKWS